MRLTPYGLVKNSGVSWLGDVPEHWRLLPGRACYHEMDVPNTEMIERHVLSLSFGQIVVKLDEALHGLVPASFETYQLINPGDIVVRPTDLQNDWNSLRFALSEHRGIITSAYICLRTQEVVTREYGYRLLLAYDLKKVFYGLGSGLRQNLGWTDFKYLPCLVPPIDEQLAIVRFLDHADRGIRRAIRAKQKLIALLNEQKQAVIHRAVTRGLDPNVRLKPSGVDWLEDVPEHWEVVPLKRRVGFQEGPGIMGFDFRDEGVPLLRISCLAGEHATLDGCNFLDPTDVEARWKHFAVQAGDYLLSASGSLGSVSRATEVVAGAIPYTGILRLWAKDQDAVDMEYVRHFLASDLFAAQISFMKAGVGIEHFGPTHLKQMIIVLPPLREQRELVGAVATRTEEVDAVATSARQEIALLGEYRMRLIADVVTGKLDVREAAARLPDELDVPELPAELDVEQVDESGVDDLEPVEA
jgi:type I restriction enzyme S subunit